MLSFHTPLHRIPPPSRCKYAVGGYLMKSHDYAEKYDACFIGFEVGSKWQSFKNKNLIWQFRRIFRWLRRGVLHFFCRPCFHGEICKTNGCKMDATLKIIKSVHFVLQISPRKHGLQKKRSTPRRSQQKILRNCHLNFFICETLSQRFFVTK